MERLLTVLSACFFLFFLVKTQHMRIRSNINLLVLQIQRCRLTLLFVPDNNRLSLRVLQLQVLFLRIMSRDDHH